MRRTARLKQTVAKLLIVTSAIVVLCILAVVISHILINGLPLVNLAYLTTDPDISWGNPVGGIRSTVWVSCYLAVIALLVAVPIGVGAAVYFTEYAKVGAFVTALRFAVESLAGVPSIVFGLFGYALFVISLGLQWSILSGGLTLACMILPTIIRTSEEALRSVPLAFREASLSLGATRWQTIWRVVVPSASPGIVTGIILGVGRAVGETAAVMLTAGMSLGFPILPTQPGRSMAVHLYTLAQEHIAYDQSYATAAVLVLVILAIDAAASLMRRRTST